MIPIRIVACTRHNRKDFAGTPLGVTLQRFAHLSFIEAQLFTNNTLGLSQRYNEAIEAAAHDPAILVFVHDDVEITDWFWYLRLAAALDDYHLVGLAGNSAPLPKQTSWAIIDFEGTLSDRQHWAGCVARGNGEYLTSWDVFASPNREVFLLDGLFMAAHSKTFHDNDIRFDDQFTFHHYDMDICQQFEAKDLSMYVSSISVIHHSKGLMGPAWKESAQRYLSKWYDNEN
jgi:GT2 family glycosyltransferase